MNALNGRRVLVWPRSSVGLGAATIGRLAFYKLLSGISDLHLGDNRLFSFARLR